MRLLIIQPLPIICYLDHLRPKYHPQHPIIEHPRPMSFPQCEKPCFTLVYNSRQNYISIYFLLISFETIYLFIICLSFIS